MDNLGYDAPLGSFAFKALHDKTLAPPTASQFDRRQWDISFAAQNEVTADDWRLYTAASWIGGRLSSLREALCPVFRNFSRSQAIELSVAYVNMVYLRDREKFRNAARKAAIKHGASSAILAHTTIKKETGQEISQDHLVTTLIDALPHVLFHTTALSEELHDDATDVGEVARSYAFGNIEFVYRAVWQQALWEGYWLRAEQQTVLLEPPSRRYGAWWPVWDFRRQSLIIEELSIRGYGLFTDFRKDDYGGQIPAKRIKSCVKVGKRWKYKTESAGNRSRAYRTAVAALVGIDQVALTAFLDQTVPAFKEHDLTFRDVLNTWHVLEWLCEARATTLPLKGDIDISLLRKFSIKHTEDELAEIVSSCLGVKYNTCASAIRFLTIDDKDVVYLFNKGAWAKPIVRSANQKTLYLAMPVFVIGNIVRAFENWIELAGLSNSGEIKGSGFEKSVYFLLLDTLADSELPARMYLAGPNLKIDDEEVDAILFVNGTVFILECKSFLTPGDPIERHNVIKRLRKGAEQASRKAAKASKSMDELRIALQLPEEDLIEAVEGVVVTASAYGVGLNFDGVPVVDASYLSTILSSESITTTMAKWKGEYYTQETHLYRPLPFNMARFKVLLSDPFVQHDLLGSIDWTYQPFPSGSPEIPFMLPFPLVRENKGMQFAKQIRGGLS